MKKMKLKNDQREKEVINMDTYSKEIVYEIFTIENKVIRSQRELEVVNA